MNKGDRKKRGVPWMCGRGHVLGLVMTTKINGHWETRLLKFRHAVSETQKIVDVDSVLIGTVRDIVCDACPPEERLMRTWWGRTDLQAEKLKSADVRPEPIKFPA